MAKYGQQRALNINLFYIADVITYNEYKLFVHTYVGILILLSAISLPVGIVRICVTTTAIVIST